MVPGYEGAPQLRQLECRPPAWWRGTPSVSIGAARAPVRYGTDWPEASGSCTAPAVGPEQHNVVGADARARELRVG